MKLVYSHPSGSTASAVVGRHPAERDKRRLRLFASGTVLALVASLFAAVGFALPAQAADGETVVSLTFDDANANQLAAAQTMQSKALPGTFFIPSGFVGAADHLTQADVATIAGLGNEIGGHSVTHPDLPTLPTSDAKREICNDRVALTGWGYDITSFAYPFASSNAAVEALAAECGYNSARGLGDLRTLPGGACDGCDFGESLPPANAFWTQAADQVDATWTLADLQRYVTQAAANNAVGGNWVQLTFHHVCDNQCDGATPSLSITPALFDQFTTWLADWENGTTQTVKTVNAVIGGAVKPLVDGPPLVLNPPPGPGVNGVQNPSLETVGTSGFPQCWSSYPSGANTPSLTAVSPGRTGATAFTATVSDWVSGDAKAMQTAPACSPGVTPGSTYSLRGWYQSDVATQFALYYLDVNGGLVYWTSSPWFPASPTYTQAVWTTPAVPADATAISFGLSLFSNGTLTTDDYAMYDTNGAPVVGLPLTATPTPTITGTAQVGSLLTATSGTWGPEPVALAYQWSSGGVAIAGATSETYTPTAADAGKPVTVTVTGTKDGYDSATTTSAPTAAVAAATIPSVVSDTPTISGNAIVGSVLTAAPGAWSPLPVAFSYQWWVGGAAVNGATAVTYTPTPADVGKTVTVAVTGTKDLYTGATTTSAATAQVVAATTTPPPAPTASRLSGSDRYGTSAAISAANFATGVAVAYIASGTDFPDALSASAVAGRDKGPVLVVMKASIPPVIAAELERLKPKKIVLLGGPEAVSNAVQSALASYGPTSRVSGSDRYGTSAAISRANYSTGADVAYIASGTNFPDALSGSAAASTNKGPVLLVTNSTVPPIIAAELSRLNPKKIVVLGGPDAISDAVQRALTAFAPTSRTSGSDRFATSAAVSSSTFGTGGGVVYIASGGDFPDALSGGAVAGMYGAPVLLVMSSSIPPVIAAELTRLKPSKIVILGGPNAINDGVQTQLNGYLR